MSAGCMEPNDWTIREKPYDLRERLFLFACLIVKVVQFLHTRGPIASSLSYQILKSGTSAGANYEEADDGSSPRDTLSKQRITLRELKETRFRLRVVRASGFLTEAQEPVMVENDELVRIVATVIRNARSSGGDAGRVSDNGS
jgi:four helix bundle protein